MNVCGVEIVESRVALAIVATVSVVLLLGLTSLAVWADGRYQRSDGDRRETLRRANWRPPQERDEEASDGA